MEARIRLNGIDKGANVVGSSATDLRQDSAGCASCRQEAAVNLRNGPVDIIRDNVGNLFCLLVLFGLGNILGGLQL